MARQRVGDAQRVADDGLYAAAAGRAAKRAECLQFEDALLLHVHLDAGGGSALHLRCVAEQNLCLDGVEHAEVPQALHAVPRAENNVAQALRRHRAGELPAQERSARPDVAHEFHVFDDAFRRVDAELRRLFEFFARGLR